MQAQWSAPVGFPLFPVEEDNSRSLSLSPQMFTSISWRIFEEARSKRVWSISSTFEYASPFPPRTGLSFFPFFSPSISSLFFSLSLSLSIFPDLPKQPPAFGSLCVDDRLAKRDGESERCASRMESFQKCWLIRKALKESADSVDLKPSKRHSARCDSTDTLVSFAQIYYSCPPPVYFNFYFFFCNSYSHRPKNIYCGQKRLRHSSLFLHLKCYFSSFEIKYFNA